MCSRRLIGDKIWKHLMLLMLAQLLQKTFVKPYFFCLEEDGIFTNEDGSLDEEYKKDYKKYLDSVLEMHYNTDIGEQGENLVSYCEGKDTE